MSQRNDAIYTILDAAASTGAGNGQLVADWKDLILSFATDGGGDADLTVKFQGSIEDDEPAWGSAQAVDNMWDYIAVYDLEDGTLKDGDTGIVVAAADDYRNLLVNTDGLKWINANVTARTEGEVTVKLRGFQNR